MVSFLQQGEQLPLLGKHSVDLLDVLFREFRVVESLQAAIRQIDLVHTATA